MFAEEFVAPGPLKNLTVSRVHLRLFRPFALFFSLGAVDHVALGQCRFSLCLGSRCLKSLVELPSALLSWQTWPEKGEDAGLGRVGASHTQVSILVSLSLCDLAGLRLSHCEHVNTSSPPRCPLLAITLTILRSFVTSAVQRNLSDDPSGIKNRLFHYVFLQWCKLLKWARNGSNGRSE